ncbi:MAG: hypothetical protein LQ338_002290 [Usnochroma carphineum]|nr:MAG: hypothetical protein LQ338_002290 [Usnochroma carphineum]
MHNDVNKRVTVPRSNRGVHYRDKETLLSTLHLFNPNHLIPYNRTTTTFTSPSPKPQKKGKMISYFTSKKAQKPPSPSPSPVQTPPLEENDISAPVLNEEDEAFLHRLTAEEEEEGTPPPLPERPAPALPARRPQDLAVVGEAEGNAGQLILLKDAREIPLPDTPTEEEGARGEPTSGKPQEKGKKKPFSKWSFMRRDSRDRKRKAAATDLMGVAEGLKSPNAPPNEEHSVPDPEAKKEEEEMVAIMNELSLAAVNNRVFSLSKESKDLLHKFTLVLKDLMNGVPTAYDDLESLLTNSENQLERSYKHLPTFLQDLIKKLPSKMTQSIGPEMLAAAAEKQGLNSKYLNKGAHMAEKAGMKVRVPSLKDLVTKPGAVAGLLKAIMNFLKLRFPAFLGMNVLYSLGLFVLLFVFWYCHKRGKEVRLEKERALTEKEMAELDEKLAADDTTPRPTTTTAPEGADIEEVRAGMQVRDGGDDGPMGYAAQGSLAKQLEKDKRKENAILESAGGGADVER